jgi:hypothetical protein
MHPRIAELSQFLEAQHDVVRHAFESVPPFARERVPAAGGWSVANVIEHLAVVEKRVAMRIAASIGEARNAGLPRETSADPILPTVDVARLLDRGNKISAPDAIHPTGLGADAAWDALMQSWEIVRGTLIDADGFAIGMLAMPHPVLGTASLYQWFAFVGGHEARHASQIREIGQLVVSH